jgi:hypothetical protein
VIKKKDAMGGVCGTCWRQAKCVHGFGGGNLRGKRPLVLPRRRWDDDFELNVQEIRMLVVDRLDLAQGEDRWRALVNAMVNRRVL